MGETGFRCGDYVLEESRETQYGTKWFHRGEGRGMWTFSFQVTGEYEGQPEGVADVEYDQDTASGAGPVSPEEAGELFARYARHW